MSLHPQTEELLDQLMSVVRHFHGLGMYAPHAGTIDAQGQFTGTALTNSDGKQISVLQSIAHFESTFKQQAHEGRIVASGIFYHSPGMPFGASAFSLPPANTTDECHVIVGLLEHARGDSFYIMIPHETTGDGIVYASGTLVVKPATVFIRPAATPEQPWWKLW